MSDSVENPAAQCRSSKFVHSACYACVLHALLAAPHMTAELRHAANCNAYACKLSLMLQSLVLRKLSLHTLQFCPSTKAHAAASRHLGVVPAPKGLAIKTSTASHIHCRHMISEKSSVSRSLDKTEFTQTLNLQALRVQAKQCQRLMKTFAG